MRRSRYLLASVLLVVLALSGVPNAVAAVDDIPGETPSFDTWMPVNLNGDDDYSNDAVYRVWLTRGDEIYAWSSSGLFGFDLFAPGAVSVDINTPLDARATDANGDRMLSFRAPYSGTYYADAWAPGGSGYLSDQVMISWWPFTKLTLNDASTQNTSYAATAGISTTLRDGDGDAFPLAVPVEVYRSVDGGSWSLARTLSGTENPVKTYSEIVKTRTSYRMVVKEDDWAQGSTSPIKTVFPKAKLTTPVAPTTAYAGKSFRVKGSLNPQHASGSYPVRIYRWKKTSSGAWKSYGYVKAKVYNYSNYSKYSKSVTLPSRGKWRLRAYHADSGHLKTWSSKYDYVTVK